ncbi:toprim domain-containing protein [Phocaeicola sp.]|uniref:toprim domain-containing protein n=1 Tax=Phocaeicola sp. TaxID=2773926 RepID=UPI002A7F2D08|nr:toprim domain-containing protein [Phocaeicola sp.]
MQDKVMLSMESRMRGDMQVRFGGRYEETYCRKAARRLVPSLRAGRGGNIIALARELYASDSLPYLLERIAEQAPSVRPVSFSFGGQPLSKPSFQQLEVVPLSSPALLSYLRQREINTELAKRECREVRYLTGGKPYFAVGFPNRSGGYEIRNKLFKGCIAPKDITHIRQEQPKETCYLFEGFMDYLSFLTLRLERCPDRPDLDGQDYIVLNSTSNLSKAIRPLGGYGRIHCFLDNDKAGMEAVQELQKEYGLRIRDVSYIYGGYNDLNDFLCGKRSEQTERRQEKRQRQAEQPGKKGRGIRM